MSRLTPIDQFLYGLLHQYDSHVRMSGAYGEDARFPPPTLTNNILPMFTDRWATGPGQHGPEIYQRVIPALQLASRLLTEDYPLMWFSHLTFGERRSDHSGTYIVPTAYSTSPEALAKVKANIRDVGEVTTFMFMPPGYEEEAYGSTTPENYMRDFYNDFRSTDWPRVGRSARWVCARPCIVMKANFQHFFRHLYSSARQDEIYRALILFAITLVHEFTHAYNYCLTPDCDEPRWCKADNEAELGWSWEMTVMGYGLHDFKGHGDRSGKYRHLYQIKILEYHSPAEREAIFRRLAGSNRTDGRFTKCDATGRKAKPPVMDANEFRYSSYFLQNDRRANSYIAGVQTVPMTWVVDWFQENEWVRRKQYWQQRGMYVRPTLGNSFMVLYERSGHKASTMRPLNPAFTVDRDILERRAQGDHRR